MKNSSQFISPVILTRLVKSALLLFMSAYLSFGYAVKNLERFDGNEIECSEENETASEKEGFEKEIERLMVLSKLRHFRFYFRKTSSTPIVFWLATQYEGEIPTPPPRT